MSVISNIERYAKLIPIGGVMLIFFSSIKLVFYYSRFNITITDYLTIKEYATLFMKDTIVLVFFFSYLLLFGLAKKISNYSKRLAFAIFQGFKTAIPISNAILLILYSIFFIKGKIEIGRYIFLITLIAMMMMMIWLYLWCLNKKYKFHIFYLFIVTLLIYSFGSGVSDGLTVTNGENRHCYTVYLKESTLWTDDDYRYIGKTDEFIFFYEKLSMKTTIVKSSDLIKMEVYEK